MIFTRIVATEYFIRSGLVMLDHHDAATQGAALVNWFVPHDEIAFGILAATVEYAATLRFAADHRPLAALGTGNAQILYNRLCIAAFREIGASQEFAEAAKFIHHGCAAELAFLA